MYFLNQLRCIWISTLCWIALSISGIGAATAQSPVGAPIPAGIGTAKTIFISNAGAEANSISERAYGVLYSGLASWGRYQLVPEPGSADLLLELHYSSPVGATNVFKGDSLGPPQYLPRFQLMILDRPTHAILWSVTELPSGTRKQKFEETNDNAVNALIADLKSISAGRMPSAAPVTGSR